MVIIGVTIKMLLVSSFPFVSLDLSYSLCRFGITCCFLGYQCIMSDSAYSGQLFMNHGIYGIFYRVMLVGEQTNKALPFSRLSYQQTSTFDKYFSEIV